MKVQSDDAYVYIPLLCEPSPQDLEAISRELGDFQVLSWEFPVRERAKNLIDVLDGRLPPHLLASLPSSLDLIGEVAVVEVPPELEAYKHLIGEAVMRLHRRVKTVLAKAGAVEGVYRVRDFEVIAGSGETETVHREYGCVYHLDPTKVYFSPRLSHEHHRVASLVREGETVIDMFAGVGPFAIQIAKTHRHVKVYAIDINPHAVHYLRINVAKNKVESRVEVLEGDARDVIRERLVGVADRVIMNLPERAVEYVDAACLALRDVGGVVHYYQFASEPNELKSAEEALIRAVEEAGREVVRILSSRRVREVAPFRWQVVMDAEIR